MAKKKFNPELLNEELKRFKMISEYSFYHEDTAPKKDDNLILGTDLEEVEEEPADPNAAPTDDSKTAANATGADTQAPTPASLPPQGQPAAQPAADSVPADDADNLFGAGDDTEAPADDMGGMDDMGAEEAPAEDEVEVDVTQLVQSGEEAKAAAGAASEKTDELLAKFGELEQRLSAMGQISNKIEALEKEIIKRNPTPVEKLEMRSMHSYPYNIKLTDYWKDIDGYEAGDEETKPKEYVLTSDDVDSYTDASVKDTFSIPDYEEEDI